MFLTASIATAAAWSYNCPFIRQLRQITSYKLFGRQEGITSIFESRKHQHEDLIKAFESSKHHCCPSACSSEISLQRTWTHHCHEGATHQQSRGFKEALQPYFSSSRCAFQHWKAYALWGRSDAAMLSCHLCMDGWLLPKHSLALNQAAPLPSVWSTKIII